MDNVEFDAVMQPYAVAKIGFSAVNKIPWGAFTDDQYNIALAKVAGAGVERARSLRGQRWDPRIFNVDDRGMFNMNIFDMIGRQYERNDPEYYFKYFYQEAAASADWGAIASVFNMLFEKDLTGPQPAVRFRPALNYAKTVGADGLATYLFTGGAPAAETWRNALIALMAVGFTGVPKKPSIQMDPSLAGAMLESRFVEQIAGQVDGFLGSHKIRVFWRCDSRNKANFLDTRTAEASVDLRDRAAELNLSQSWSPYSADKIKNVMWLRKSQRDNDYYTIVSVGIDFKTCTSFPTLDEEKNPDYRFPMKGDQEVKPLVEWTEAELLRHSKNLALVTVVEGGKSVDKIRICTKTHAYMSVIHDGFVINTQSFGGGTFPERAVRGLPVDAVVAYLPFLRVHHGGTRTSGFTIFPAPGDPAIELVDESDLRNRFGQLAGEIVHKAYFDARTEILSRMKSAWAANGSAAPDVRLDVQRVRQRPLMEKIKPGDVRLK